MARPLRWYVSFAALAVAVAVSWRIWLAHQVAGPVTAEVSPQATGPDGLAVVAVPPSWAH